MRCFRISLRLCVARMDKELSIIIIEDVDKDAEAIQEELRNEAVKFSARRVETREQLLSQLEQAQPDIILSDFTLPEFDAIEALHVLREHHYDIPLILVTGTRSEEVAVECIKEGAEDYILKASLKRLPSSIVNVLKKREAEREKARAEEALRRSEEQYRLITENTHDLISLLDLEGRFLYASPSFRAGLGYAPEELTGTDSLALVHPDDRSAVATAWRQALLSRQSRVVEFRARHQQGDWRILESIGNWTFDPSNQPQRSVIVSRDITERKAAEETLRSLPRLILEAQEAERRRVARELHDSVNQILSSVKFRIQSLEERLVQRRDQTGPEAEQARLLLDKAMQEVRRISHNLRPSELDDLGLVPALRSLCQEWQERTGIAVQLQAASLPQSWPGEVELNLYRILQEALTNVEKHSRASRVSLALTREGQLLLVRIQDDGVGFNAPPAFTGKPKRPGMGLVDMTERAASVGGSFELRSAPGQGTTILLRIPLGSPHLSATKTRDNRTKEKNKTAPRR